MQPIIIVIHLLIVIALVGVVLIQRSEGGGLGIGGGSGFMTARGAANALTRTTAILAAAFFATSIMLGVMAHRGGSSSDILDRIPAAVPGSQTTPAAPGSGGVLNQLGGASSQPTPPAATAPAETAPTQATPEKPADTVPNSQ
ncbi:preprotein translocase subunit SecG [Brucella endophytica]|uniref:preprotein translocase subunit SecG n=1 Tax=Brucella endophytica TaxID=1963359 RepID=UPI0016655220|nr:preprotein translocase subunit SecG [Brucella endophytica]